jgi:hypothetical protein
MKFSFSEIYGYLKKPPSRILYGKGGPGRALFLPEKEADEHSGRGVDFYPSALKTAFLIAIENLVTGLPSNSKFSAKFRHRLAG